MPTGGDERLHRPVFFGVRFTKTLEAGPFLRDDKLWFLQSFFLIINGLTIAIEEIGQPVGNVFRIKPACFGIAKNRAGEITGGDDDEAVRSTVEDMERWPTAFGNSGIDPFQIHGVFEIGLDELRAQGLGALLVDLATKGIG